MARRRRENHASRRDGPSPPRKAARSRAAGRRSSSDRRVCNDARSCVAADNSAARRAGQIDFHGGDFLKTDARQLARRLANRSAFQTRWATHEPRKKFGAPQLATDEATVLANGAKAVKSLKAELSDCEAKLDMLLDMFLNTTISHTEQASKKHVLLNQKVAIREKLTGLEGGRAKRFEPLVEFIYEAKQAVFWHRKKIPTHVVIFSKNTI